MPDTHALVINTAPLIALVAALDNLRILQTYDRVQVPREVCQEILVGGPGQFAVAAFEAAHWLQKNPAPVDNITAVLLNSLDTGEAAVIQLALDEHIQTVCIDEIAGRRMARLHGLAVTGSLGVLLRARRAGYNISLRDALQRMRNRGIWLSDRVINFALAQAGENPEMPGA